MNSILKLYILSKQPVLLRLRGDLQPPPGMIGPGQVEALSDEMRTAMIQGGGSVPDDLFVFQMPIQQQDGRKGTLPMILRPEDVLWLSPGVKLEETPRIVTAGGPLSFGGRS